MGSTKINLNLFLDQNTSFHIGVVHIKNLILAEFSHFWLENSAKNLTFMRDTEMTINAMSKKVMVCYTTLRFTVRFTPKKLCTLHPFNTLKDLSTHETKMIIFFAVFPKQTIFRPSFIGLLICLTQGTKS